jgi:hypothetical protein
MSFDVHDIDALNENISGWDDRTKKDVLSEMDRQNIKHSKNSPNNIPLRRAFKSKLKKKFELVSVISYSMPRSAVFLHKGVSSGHPISNPRTAKPWFNPVIDAHLDELGNIVADGQGNLVINALHIK